MYHSYASCINSPRSTAPQEDVEPTFGPARWSKQNGEIPSIEDFRRRPFYYAISIATRILQAPEIAFEDVLESGGSPLAILRNLFETEREDLYDYDLESITWRRRLIKNAIKREDADDILFYFRSVITRNIGGISNPYAEAPDAHDRKHTFNRYKPTVLQATVRVEELFDASTNRDDRARIYECVCDTISEFGRSATLLSGGGTLGMYHIGILKALRGTNPRLISQVICGASAGSIVAAVFGSKKDGDLDEAVQRLCHGDLDVFVSAEEKDQGWLARLRLARERRSLYDPKNLSRVMKDLLGEKLTFKDAFNLTGKRLNITVSTSDSDKDDFRLLNYITSPDVVVWSAVVASCAVPFAFPPGQLWFRDTDMSLKKVDTPVGHMDGSIYGDVPMDRMSREFNINYFIVSQVNPHVVPFLDTNKTSSRWLQYPYYTASKDLVRNALLTALEPLKESRIPGSELARGVYSIFHQRYEGDLTMFPIKLGRNLPDVLNCMNNPTHEFMDRAVENGEKEAERMLPKAHAVLDVEMILQDLKVQLKTKLKFSKSEEDLHRKAIEDRMLSGRSYSALSRRGGHSRHASTRSVALPSAAAMQTNAKAHRTTQSLELGYLQRNVSAQKVAGSVYSSGDNTTSTTTSDNDSDVEPDESDEEDAIRGGGLRIAMPSRNLQRFTSNPPSPIETRRRSYFPPSRSSSRSSTSRSSSHSDPRSGLLNLMMTPRAPSTRSASPVQSRKGPWKESQYTASAKGGGAGACWKKRLLPASLRSLIDRQSGVTVPMNFQMGRGFLRKRSLSAAGIDDWVREKGSRDRADGTT